MDIKTDLWNEFEKTGTVESYLKYKENGLKNSIERETNEDKKEAETWELSKPRAL